MKSLIKHSFGQKGWLLTTILAVAGPLSPFIINKFTPIFNEKEGLIFENSEITIDNGNYYHKSSKNVATDCSSGVDESIKYLNHHADMVKIKDDISPRVIFDTAIWGIALSDCYSNTKSEELSLFLLRVLVAKGECGEPWKSYSNTARAFLESYIGDHVVINDEAFPTCASQRGPAA